MTERAAMSDDEWATHLAMTVGPCTCDGETGCDEEGDCRWCKAADPEWMCPGEAAYQYPKEVTHAR